MQIRSKRERFLLLFGIPVGLIVLAWNFLSSTPTGPAKAALLPRATAEKQHLDARRKYGAMQADNERLAARIAAISSTLPPDQLVPRMIRDLQAISVRSGVHLREVKTLRARAIAGGSGTRVPVEVRFRAPFQPGAVRFLYYAEEPAAHMVVEKVNITSADAHFKTVDVSAQISVFTRAAAGPSGPDSGDSTNATDRSTSG